jgi:PadR family transcriptional regulator, regulatory protein PadR
MSAIDTRALDRELKRGSAELLILSLLDARPRHGYELSKLISVRSGGQLTFHIDSLYPLLYRLEERGWIQGAWVEKAGERRRRFYRVTAVGRRPGPAAEDVGGIRGGGATRHRRRECLMGRQVPAPIATGTPTGSRLDELLQCDRDRRERVDLLAGRPGAAAPAAREGTPTALRHASLHS